LIGRLPWDWWNHNNQEKTYQNSQIHRHARTPPYSPPRPEALRW
jgi:hypothetical protein